MSFSSQGFKRYFANTSWMLFEKLMRMTVVLFVGSYVARYLGPERFGILSFAISLVTIFSAIASLGLEEIAISKLVLASCEREKLLGTVFTLKLVGSLLLITIIIIIAQLVYIDILAKTLVLIIAGGVLFQSFNVIDFYFQSQVLAKVTISANVISLMLSSGIKLYLIYIEASLKWFAWAIVVENAMLALFLIFLYYRKDLIISRWRFEKKLAISLMLESWPLIFSGLAVMIYMRIDQVMIMGMLGGESLGNYAAAVRLSEAWYFLPMAVSSSIFPAIVNAKNNNNEIYLNRIQKLYDLMLWLGIAIAIPTTLLAENIINLLFGTKYFLAADVLKINIWAGIFVFLGVASGKYLLVENLNYLSMIRTVIGCLLNIVLNFILIPAYGINGAAWATLISYLVANFSLFFNPRARMALVMMFKSFIPGKRLWRAY